MSARPPRWYHVSVTAYGAWLPGDPRGFRTRKHREHVEGDYKNPPPAGKYETRHRNSREKMKYEPALLTPPQREITCFALRDRIAQEGLIVCVAMGGRHGHLLVKGDPARVKWFVGLGKKHAWYELKAAGMPIRSMWADGCGVKPVRDRAHQMNVYRYLVRHRREGAFVWAVHEDAEWREAHP